MPNQLICKRWKNKSQKLLYDENICKDQQFPYCRWQHCKQLKGESQCLEQKILTSENTTNIPICTCNGIPYSTMPDIAISRKAS